MNHGIVSFVIHRRHFLYGFHNHWFSPPVFKPFQGKIAWNAPVRKEFTVPLKTTLTMFIGVHGLSVLKKRLLRPMKQPRLWLRGMTVPLSPCKEHIHQWIHHFSLDFANQLLFYEHHKEPEEGDLFRGDKSNQRNTMIKPPIELSHIKPLPSSFFNRQTPYTNVGRIHFNTAKL